MNAPATARPLTPGELEALAAAPWAGRPWGHDEKAALDGMMHFIGVGPPDDPDDPNDDIDDGLDEEES